MYVCPGFTQGILTFDDGSSIICGGLNDSRYAQKLDLYGYKMWEELVIVHYNDSSDMFISGESERDWFCSGGDTGIIVFFWQDYRGADHVRGEPLYEYKNSTTYYSVSIKTTIFDWGRME